MTALREAVARAINLEIKRQMAGQPLPGPASRATDWSAVGDVGTLDLALIADAAIAAVCETIYEEAGDLCEDVLCDGEIEGISLGEGNVVVHAIARKFWKMADDARCAIVDEALKQEE